MKKIVFLTAIAMSFCLMSGCFLDDWFGDDDEQGAAVVEYATISGTVSIPEAGAKKVSGKIQYKVAPTTTKVYLLLSSASWTEKLAFATNAVTSTTVDENGIYKFEMAIKDISYCIIIDINADGKCDEFITGITAGDTSSTTLKSFIRDLNIDATVLLGITLDKDEYAQGDTVIFTVTGYVTAASDVHAEVWNEGSTTGTYIWAATPVACPAGAVSKTFTHEIPVNGWASTSTSVDYKAFAAIGAKLFSSDEFDISGTNTGDTTAPTVGILAINNGVAKTGSIDVTLNITIPDSNATQMIVSNIPGDYSNSTWKTAATTCSWTLAGGVGTKTVYITFADASGNKTDEFSDTIEYTEDLIVINVTSTTADGSYKNGDADIPISVEFSQVVTVTGAPTLTVSHDSGADVVCALAVPSGSGTATLTFTYIIPGATDDADLCYKAIDSLTVGTSIKNAAGTDATLTLPAPGAAGSLDYNKAIVIDNTAPLASKPTAVAQILNRAAVSTSTVQSNDSGKIYMVLNGELASTTTEIDTAVTASKGFLAKDSAVADTAYTVTVAAVDDGTYDIVAVDNAGNVSGIIPGWLTIDSTDPTIVAIASIDASGNGVVDGIEIEFSKAIKDSTLATNYAEWRIDETGQTGWTEVGTGASTSTTFVSGGLVNVTDDKYYTITFSETDVTNTGVVDYNYTKGSVTDAAGNFLASVNGTALDKAPPKASAPISVAQRLKDGTLSSSTVQSNDTGAIYLILNGEAATTKAELDIAVAANKGFIGVPSPTVNIPSKVIPSPVGPKLADGVYDIYAIDAAENVSAVVAGWLTVDNTPPVLLPSGISVDNRTDPHKVILTFDNDLDATAGAPAYAAGHWTGTVVGSSATVYTFASASLSGKVVTLTLTAANPAVKETFITNAEAAGIVVTPKVNILDLAQNAYPAATSITADNSAHTLATPPTIAGIWTIDFDKNGIVDRLEIKFSEAIKDSTVDETMWSLGLKDSGLYVAGTNLSVVTSFTAVDTTVSGVDDAYIQILFVEGGNLTTTGIMDYVFNGGTPSITCLYGNAITSIAATAATDKADPIVDTWTADFNLNGDEKKIVFNFSEDILKANFDLTKVSLDDSADNGSAVVLVGTETETDANTITLTVLTAAKIVLLNAEIAKTVQTNIGNVVDADLNLLLAGAAITDASGNTSVELAWVANKTGTVTADTTDPQIEPTGTGCTAVDGMAAGTAITITWTDYMTNSVDVAGNYSATTTGGGTITSGASDVGVTGLLEVDTAAFVNGDTIVAGANCLDLGSNVRNAGAAHTITFNLAASAGTATNNDISP